MFRLVPPIVVLVLLVADGARIPISDDRIVGGENASIKDHPFQASLQYLDEHFCGGSIVSETRVLTAAHCTDGLSTSYLSVRVGSTYHSRDGEVVKVDYVHQHYLYNGKTGDYDVAVLVLATPLTFGPTIRAIPLQEADEELAAGTSCIATGWGTLVADGSYSPVLKYVRLPKVSDEACRDAYGKSRITPRMTCHGFLDGSKDSCEGDSGGPLVTSGVQVGIVSWGFGCSKPKYPGVYTKIAHNSIHSFIKNYL